MTEKIKISSKSDDLKLSLLVVEPESAPKAVFQLVHGMAEHKERYLPFMEFLASKGYASVIHDHRGHGESVLSAEDQGYFYRGGWKALVEDVHSVNEWVHSRWSGLPVVLFGHSMGSMAVRSYAKRYDSTISALWVCGCPSYNAGAKAGILLSRLIGAVKGDRFRSNLIQKIGFGGYAKAFKGETSPACWVCSDPEAVKAYDADPLCGYVFTVNGFEGLFSLMEDCYSLKGWKVERPGLPVRFISGADDPCAISEKAFEGAVENIRKVGYTDVKSRRYEGMRHEILNERRKEQVWNDILEETEKIIL